MDVNEVRALSNEELMDELEEQQRGLMNLRFQQATLQLNDVNELKNTRRAIAKIKTVLREREIAEALQQ